MKKKLNKNKYYNSSQKSFYFEDYLETNQIKKKRINSNISEDRIYILFFFFFCLVTLFALKISIISFQKPAFLVYKNNTLNFSPLRRDIVDRNGDLISRNVEAFHAAVKPNLVKDKDKFLLNIKIIFPKINKSNLKKKLSKNKYFYLKKGLTDEEKQKLWSLGEKGIVFESYQRRINPHSNLYSHIIGQIDYDNYGISGVEGFFDKDLRDQKKINTPFKITLDTNLQHIIKKELEKSMFDFKAKQASGLLMDVNSGEVLSLVSLPDYDINKRKTINDTKYMNQITKGVFELGSVFKTFTLALAIEEKIVKAETVINNIPNKIKCSVHTISELKDFPSDLKAEDILIRSSNIGTLMIARKIGEDKYKSFLKKLNLINRVDFEIDEIGEPLNFKWNKCKLETVSFGHGITTTPLQAAAAYATISNGGFIIKPTLKKNNKRLTKEQIITSETSNNINKILRKVVTDEEGTASLADIYGYQVAGKTGTSKKYGYENKNINTFISIFPYKKPKYVLLVMLDEPQIASHLTYNYRGMKIKGSRNESGWNAVYVSGEIIKQIGPILAINNEEFHNYHVVKKNN